VRWSSRRQTDAILQRTGLAKAIVGAGLQRRYGLPQGGIVARQLGRPRRVGDRTFAILQAQPDLGGGEWVSGPRGVQPHRGLQRTRGFRQLVLAHPDHAKAVVRIGIARIPGDISLQDTRCGIEIAPRREAHGVFDRGLEEQKRKRE
jgi:hypothetical protein